MDLRSYIASLVACGEPVSFLDAYVVVRRAERSPDLAADELEALIGLHDHDATTKGGRSVLAEFLRGVAQARERERALASRPIKLSDSGKVARASAGTTLALKLPSQAFLAHEVSGPIELVPMEASILARAETQLLVRLLRPGTGYVRLVETGPRARRLELRVCIE